MKLRIKKIICNSLIIVLLAVALVSFAVALFGEGDAANWLCLASVACVLVIPLDFWLERLKKV